jgi:hypothetical protein
MSDRTLTEGWCDNIRRKALRFSALRDYPCRADERSVIRRTAIPLHPHASPVLPNQAGKGLPPQTDETKNMAIPQLVAPSRA